MPDTLPNRQKATLVLIPYINLQICASISEIENQLFTFNSRICIYFNPFQIPNSNSKFQENPLLKIPIVTFGQVIIHCGLLTDNPLSLIAFLCGKKNGG